MSCKPLRKKFDLDVKFETNPLKVKYSQCLRVIYDQSEKSLI